MLKKRENHLTRALFQSVVSLANCFLFFKISGRSSCIDNIGHEWVMNTACFSSYSLVLRKKTTSLSLFRGTRTSFSNFISKSARVRARKFCIKQHISRTFLQEISGVKGVFPRQLFYIVYSHNVKTLKY